MCLCCGLVILENEIFDLSYTFTWIRNGHILSGLKKKKKKKKKKKPPAGFN